MGDHPRNLIRVGGLWRKTSEANGAKYLTGRLGPLRILVFENTRKQGDNSPDFSLFLAPAEDDQGGGERQQRPEAKSATPRSAKPAQAPIEDDDIPF